MKNLVKMSNLSNEEVYDLIKRALKLKNGEKVDTREDLYVANLFFENSTRTKCSFEAAERHFKLNIINLKDIDLDALHYHPHR